MPMGARRVLLWAAVLVVGCDSRRASLSRGSSSELDGPEPLERAGRQHGARRGETDPGVLLGFPRARWPGARKALSWAVIPTTWLGVYQSVHGTPHEGRRAGTDVFQRLDLNGDGRVDRSECRRAVRGVFAMGEDAEIEEDASNAPEWIEELFGMVDADGNGSLSPEEVEVLELTVHAKALMAAQQRARASDDDDAVEIEAVARLVSAMGAHFNGHAYVHDLVHAAEDLVFGGEFGDIGPEGLQRLTSLFKVSDHDQDGYLDKAEEEYMWHVVDGALAAVEYERRLQGESAPSAADRAA